MEITVNHQNYLFPEACSVQQMLEHVLSQPTKGIAVAVNKEIISKNNWQTFQLTNGDHITIIKATQGG